MSNLKPISQDQTLLEFRGKLLIPIRKDYFMVGNTRLFIDAMFVIIYITKDIVIFPEHEFPKHMLVPFLPKGTSLQQSLQHFVLNNEALLKSCVLNRVGYKIPQEE